MEEEERKTRADFDTDSEYYTYMITHPEEDEEEEESEQYPLLIVECMNCKNIIDENELKPKPDTSIPYDKRLRCPKCGKRRFKVIKSKEEKEKIEKKRKEEEKKKKKNDMKLLVATLKKIRIELEDIRDDLMEDLDSGKITPARFAALLINLTANVYKYYRKDDNVSLYWSTFRDFAYETSKNVLEREYESEKLDDVLSKLLNEYKDVQDFDLKYLNYSKDFLARSLADYNEAMDREELEHDLSDIERKIELQEKYNEKVKDIEKSNTKEYNSKDSYSFFKELARYNDV